MHILEAALFANLASKEQWLPEHWRPAFDKPQLPSRPFRAAAIRALTGMFALAVVISALTIVCASRVDRAAVMAGLLSDAD